MGSALIERDIRTCRLPHGSQVGSDEGEGSELGHELGRPATGMMSGTDQSSVTSWDGPQPGRKLGRNRARSRAGTVRSLDESWEGHELGQKLVRFRAWT